ncbi:MAG: TlpA family protein disulfide reductase [Rhizobiales bacterium]|nr:TlpA family protein disulfide reductase [Hyphomicrobiales bacterium]
MSVESTKEPSPVNPSSRNRSLWAIGLVALCAGILGVYLIGGEPRKPTEETQTASNLRQLAKGPMAAFVVKPAGEPITNIKFQDESGAETGLDKWKGRVVLLNLWATWCAPCRKEMPELDALQQKLGSPHFEVVAISVDRQGVPVARKFLDETKAGNLKLYVDTTARSLDAMKAVGLPATILIDREGKELGRLLGPADWASPEAVALVQQAIAAK